MLEISLTKQIGPTVYNKDSCNKNYTLENTKMSSLAINMNGLHISVMPKDILALSEQHLPTEYSTAMSVEWQKESLVVSSVSFDDYVYFIKHKTWSY